MALILHLMVQSELSVSELVRALPS
jgi:hypothetical protein